MLAGRADEKGLQLLCDVDPAIPTVMTGDFTRLRQVILNLAGNAIKFTSEGEISLAAKIEQRQDQGLMLRITISDTGIGIPQSQLTHIFEPFSQADSSTTRKYGGTGLGLTISARLVEAMGGTTSVVSEVGRGSRFSFTAFLGDADVTAVAGAERAFFPAVSRVLDILVADDNRINQRVASGMLEKRGHRVTLAVNGQEVLDLLETQAFDLILMDVQMPVISGVDATIEIRRREQKTRHHVPIYALTANAMKGDRERYVSSGMDGYLSKPIVVDQLDQLLRESAAQIRPHK
jgi:CheY-like chemotaxis protein